MSDHFTPMNPPAETAVDKALLLLELLDGSQAGKTLSELCEQSNLPKTTVHRLLKALATRGFATRTQWNGYRIGPKIIALGAIGAEKDSLLVIARPILWDLMKACQETVQLGVVMQQQLMFVERVEPENVAVRIASMPSPLSELHTSSMGKAILAASSEEYVEAFLARDLNRYTERTITDPDTLRKELDIIRRNGFAQSMGERHDGVFALGAAVMDRHNTPIAAISVAAPMHRVYGNRASEIAKRVVNAANSLTRMIAHSNVEL